MAIRTSFRSKLMLLTIVPLAVAQIVTLFAVMRTVENEVGARARESLVVGNTVVSEFLRSRGEQLRTSVTVLASDFGLKEAAALQDAATVHSVLSNHSRRVGAEMAMLLDLDGTPIVSTLNQDAIQSGDLRVFLNQEENQSLETAAMYGDTAYHVFVVPLRAPTTIGWVALGFRVDKTLESRLSNLTGLNVSIKPAETAPPVGLQADNKNLTYSLPFIDGSTTFSVVLQRSLEEAMLPYVEARRGLALFTGTLLLLVTVAGVLFSTTIAKPLRTLAFAANRIISGNYEGTVNLHSDDEFGELASSFDAMRVAISEREQRISHQATHDSTTDLPNRFRVLQILTAAIESARDGGRNVSVLSIHLSRMGEISSTLGHKATDELIKQAARHLRVNLNNEDFLGHIGTNEFVLVLPGHDSASALSSVERIQQILNSGVTLDRVDVSLQAEIGISEFPEHGDAAAELLRFASIARTEATTDGERVRVYEAGNEEKFVRRLRVVNDLRGAILHEEIEVWYQPKISLNDFSICGAEALVRWEHPDFGFLTPDEFIPAIEQAGSIIHLTRYVLKIAVEQCRLWDDRGNHLGISVNLSARDLGDEYLPYHVLQILKDNNVEPHRLTLEITESSIMENVKRAMLVLECLRDIGVRISMDDFGTGHSSLAQIRNIPLHELKIDKSFVIAIDDDPKSEAIVRTTIELAHNLGARVVAEGVENESAMRHISSLGADEVQGYFFSKPLAAELFECWLDAYVPLEFPERRDAERAFATRA